MTDHIVVQATDWTGESGEPWVVYQIRLDAITEVFGQAAINAALPVQGERVLDVGCGAGSTSFDLANYVGANGHVFGVDISKPLIERARALAPRNMPVRFEIADATNIELRECQFDILFSRFGVMFFNDPTAAFAHLRGCLKPGGRLAFVCWRTMAENEWVRLPMTAIKGILPATPPPSSETPGPFSFGDQGRVSRILTGAGFSEVTLTPCDASVPFGIGETRDAAVDDAVKMTLEVGPLSRALAGQSEDVQIRAAEAVRAAYIERADNRSLMLNGAAWVVTARN